MTDNQTSREALEPSWQDREAANAIRNAMHDGNWGISADAHDWRSDHPLLQAIATWNRSAIAVAPAADEPVGLREAVITAMTDDPYWSDAAGTTEHDARLQHYADVIVAKLQGKEAS